MADENKKVTTTIVFDVDKSAQRKTTKTLDAVKDSVGGIEKELTSAEKEASQLDKTLSRLDADNLGRAEVTLKKVNKSMKDVGETTKKTRSAIQQYNDEFDRVSRDVGLAGDVQSNLGALGGLAGYAGAGGLGTGLAVTGELSAMCQ